MKKDKGMGDRLGGVTGNRIEMFKPSKENSHALRGEMEWNGGNNDALKDSAGKAKARYK